MAATHVYATPPAGVAPDWTMPQDRDRFTAEEHATWDKLVARQSRDLSALACQSFLAGLDILRLQGVGDVLRVEAEVGELGGIEPDAHRILGAEELVIPHAGRAAYCVLHV